MSKLAKNGNGDNEMMLNELFEGVQINVQAEEDTKQIYNSKSGYTPPADAKLFRRFGTKGAIHKLTSFEWCQPGDEINELWRTVNAIRGYMVKVKSGFALYAPYDADDKTAKRGPVCTTTRAQFGDTVILDQRPYPYAYLYGPNVYGAETTPDPDLDSKIRFYGSRGLSCADCVRNRDHIIAGAAKSADSVCGLTTSIVFAVTELGYLSQGKLTWIKINELQDPENPELSLYNGPIIVTGDISKTAAFKNQEVSTSTDKKGCVVPPDAKPLRPFWLDRAGAKKIVPTTDPVTPAYWTGKIEMYLGIPTDPEARTASVPVFRVAEELSPEVVTEYKTIMADYRNQVNEYNASVNLEAGGPLSEFPEPRSLNISASTEVIPTEVVSTNGSQAFKPFKA